MAATAVVNITVECDGLGAGLINLPKKFTDSATPDDYRRVDTVLSTTAILLSTIANVPSAEILGMGVLARDGAVYVNTISTTVSTAGTYIPDGQANFQSFMPGNACKITMMGADADTAVTTLIYAALTV